MCFGKQYIVIQTKFKIGSKFPYTRTEQVNLRQINCKWNQICWNISKGFTELNCDTLKYCFCKLWLFWKHFILDLSECRKNYCRALALIQNFHAQKFTLNPSNLILTANLPQTFNSYCLYFSSKRDTKNSNLERWISLYQLQITFWPYRLRNVVNNY